MLFSLGMSIRWDYFINQYDTSRYTSAVAAAGDGGLGGGRLDNNRHVQFVREFASVVSMLQVGVPLPLLSSDADNSSLFQNYRIKQTISWTCSRISCARLRI